MSHVLTCRNGNLSPQPPKLINGPFPNFLQKILILREKLLGKSEPFMQNKLEGSFNLFPGMHIRSVTKCTTRLHDYEPMYIIVSPENLDRGSLAAESRRITPNQAKSHL